MDNYSIIEAFLTRAPLNEGEVLENETFKFYLSRDTWKHLDCILKHKSSGKVVAVLKHLHEGLDPNELWVNGTTLRATDSFREARQELKTQATSKQRFIIMEMCYDWAFDR